jgi:hypothetical protein
MVDQVEITNPELTYFFPEKIDFDVWLQNTFLGYGLAASQLRGNWCSLTLQISDHLPKALR